MLNRIKTNTVVWLCNFLLLLCFNTTTYAQKDYTVFNYNTKNGLPQNNIISLAGDSLGFLWIGTESGLLRFDGRNFKSFTTTNSAVLESNYLQQISTTFNNQIVVGDLYGGFYLINNNTLILLRKGNLDVLNYLFISGRLPGIPFYIKNTTPNARTALDKSWMKDPLCIYPQSTNDYLVQTKNGVACYKNNVKINELNLTNYHPKTMFGINNNVYFVDQTNAVFLIDPSNYSIVPCHLNGAALPAAITRSSVFYNAIDYTSIFVASNTAYCLRATTNPTEIDVNLLTNQLPLDCAIKSIVLSEKNHSIAVGTDSKGLFIFKENNFKSQIYVAANGTGNAYYSMLALDSTTILSDWNRQFDSNGATLSKLKITRNNGENIFRDHQNHLWFSFGDSLYKFYPESNTSKFISHLKNDKVLSFEQSGDSILIGTTISIGSIKNDSIHIICHLNSKASNSNLYREFIVQNKLWFCNYKGVYMLDLKTQQIDTLKQLYQKYVHNMIQYHDYILIGTYGSGYYLYKNGKTVMLPLDAGNYLLNVHQFIFDDYGIVWMSTNHGVLKTRFENLEQYFNDTTSAVYYMYYNEDNGMRTSEFNGGCSPSGLLLKNGEACLPSMDGIVRFNPRKFEDPYFNFPVTIDGFFLNDKLDTAVIKVFPPGTQNIRIEFATAYWGNLKNLQLQYKLSGLNEEWKQITQDQNSIEFTGLHYGQYTLQIRKRVGFGATDFIVTSIDFKIEKKFYETAWFFLLSILMAIIFVITVARLYANNIKKRNKALEEKINLRTFELQNANHELQQSITVKDKLISIISHDIVTPLRFISMVARKAVNGNTEIEKENMRTALSEIRNTSEKLRDNAQNILNWMKFQNKRINLVITNVAIGALVDEIAEMLKEMAEADHTLIINNISPDDIIKTDKNILSIVIHNIVTNAIKFTANGTIIIDSKVEGQNYLISITDTGAGMNELQLKRIETTIKQKTVTTGNQSGEGNGNGLGYVRISELMDLLNGTTTIESQPGNGTTVTLILKLSN